jgi:hypothetical protein
MTMRQGPVQKPHGFPLPGEIVLPILLEANELQIDQELENHVTQTPYLNRYTRAARILRCVCRIWRDIVDLPTCYQFRISSTNLFLQVSRAGVWLDTSVYHQHLERSRSRLILTYAIKVRPALVVLSGTTAEQQSASTRAVGAFVDEIHRVSSLQPKVFDLTVQLHDAVEDSPLVADLVHFFGTVDLGVTSLALTWAFDAQMGHHTLPPLHLPSGC